MRYLSLVILSSALSGCNFNYGVSPFNLTDIEKSNEQSTSDMLKFSWDGNANNIGYSICIKDDTQLNECRSILDVTSTNQAFVRLQSLLLESQNVFFVLAQDDISIQKSNEMKISTGVINSLIQYIKAHNTDPDDKFGSAVALSSDGYTLAVGAHLEDSNANTIDGDPFNNDLFTSGAVYVYRFDGSSWIKSAYIKASNSGANDRFGNSLALNADGSVLVVGAEGEASNGTGVNGTGANNDSAARAGAVYVFRLDEKKAWKEEAYIKSSNAGLDDLFGSSVSISAHGGVLAVGARGEDSNLKGVFPNPGTEINNLATDSGATYLFRYNGITWVEEAYIKASNSDTNDRYGHAVTLSTDGNTLAVGAIGESSNSSGINGVETDNSAVNAGAAYLYRYRGGVWAKQAYIKSSNPQTTDTFGFSLSLSSNGNTLAVGAIGESSNATDVNGDQINNNASLSGAGYLFTFNGEFWIQQAYLKASNTGVNDFFGYSIAITLDGTKVAVGARGESSSATGIDGDAYNDEHPNAGAVYIFKQDQAHWYHHSYVKSSNTERDDAFGSALALNATGDVIAVGATGENSSSQQVNGNQWDNSAPAAGAVYIY